MSDSTNTPQHRTELVLNGERWIEVDWPSDGLYEITQQLAHPVHIPGCSSYMGLFARVAKSDIGTPEIETYLDNAACASQVKELLRDDNGKETILREAVRLNVVKPLLLALQSEKERITWHACKAPASDGTISSDGTWTCRTCGASSDSPECRHIEQGQNAAPQESTDVRESVKTSKATEGRPSSISAPAVAAPDDKLGGPNVSYLGHATVRITAGPEVADEYFSVLMDQAQREAAAKLASKIPVDWSYDKSGNRIITASAQLVSFDGGKLARSAMGEPSKK